MFSLVFKLRVPGFECLTIVAKLLRFTPCRALEIFAVSDIQICNLKSVFLTKRFMLHDGIQSSSSHL